MCNTIHSEKINIDDLARPLLISFETNLETNENSQIFKQTLENNEWEYVFINNGTEFKGFTDKIEGYYSYLKTLPEEKIVILSDARDVLCCRSPTGFIKGFNILNKNERKIIISTELYLLGHMNWTEEEMDEKRKINPLYFYQGTLLTNYWEYYKYEAPPDKKYVNSGLIAGKVSQLKEMFHWIIENKYTDDQLGVANYANHFPERITLDVANEILHTTGFALNGGMYNIDIQTKDSPTIAELFGYSAFFLHLPGITMSKGQTLCYTLVKEIVLKNYGNIMRELYGYGDINYFTNHYFPK